MPDEEVECSLVIAGKELGSHSGNGHHFSR
jgi:hypothetical protein